MPTDANLQTVSPYTRHKKIEQMKVTRPDKKITQNERMNEMKWIHELNEWNEWNEMKWNEMKWDEMKWSEMNEWNEWNEWMKNAWMKEY